MDVLHPRCCGLDVQPAAPVEYCNWVQSSIFRGCH